MENLVTLLKTAGIATKGQVKKVTKVPPKVVVKEIQVKKDQGEEKVQAKVQRCSAGDAANSVIHQQTAPNLRRSTGKVGKVKEESTTLSGVKMIKVGQNDKVDSHLELKNWSKTLKCSSTPRRPGQNQT